MYTFTHPQRGGANSRKDLLQLQWTENQKEQGLQLKTKSRWMGLVWLLWWLTGRQKLTPTFCGSTILNQGVHSAFKLHPHFPPESSQPKGRRYVPTL